MAPDGKSTIQKFSHAASWTVLARVVMSLSGLILAVLIPRHYADVVKKNYATYEVLKWVVLATPFLFGLGLEKVIPRFLPELIRQGRFRSVRRLLWGTAGILVGALAVEGTLMAVGGSYFEHIKQVPLTPYFWVMVSLAGLVLYRMLLYNICVARFDTFIVSVANLVSCPVWVGLTILFLRYGYGLRGIFAAQAISQLIQIVVMLGRQGKVFLRSNRPEQEKDGPPQLAGVERTRLRKIMVPVLISNIQFVIITLPGELLFTFLGIKGFKDTANYGLAYSLSYLALGMFIPPIYTLALASFSDFYVKDPQKLRRGIRYFYKLLFTLLMPIAMLGVFLGDKALLVLADPGKGRFYADAAAMVPIFSIYHFYGTIFIPISIGLLTMERAMVTAPINVGQIILVLVLNAVLIPSYGLRGAMIAKFGTVLIGSVVTLWVAWRVIGGCDIPLKYLGKCLLATGSVFVLYPFTRSVDTIIELAFWSTAGVGVMVAAMRLLRLIDEEDAELIGRSGSWVGRITLGILVGKRYNNRSKVQ